MVRIEIFTNRSVEENLLDAFKKEGVASAYSKIPIVHGVGNSGPRMGDAIWPEENVAFTIWCEAGEVAGIQRAVDQVKREFPGEGIKLFGAEGDAAAAGLAVPGGTETVAAAKGFLANLIHGITGGERRKTDRRSNTAEESGYSGPERRAEGNRRTQLDRRSGLGLLKAAEVIATGVTE